MGQARWRNVLIASRCLGDLLCNPCLERNRRRVHALINLQRVCVGPSDESHVPLEVE